MTWKTRCRTIAGAVLLLPVPAFAHHAEWMTDRPFLQGLSMPIHGIDHMLVALAAGLLAVRLGGMALWLVPSAFAFFLLFAEVLNVNGIAIPGIEPAILASILVLGALLARRQPLSLVASLALVGALAVIQGEALLGAEAPASLGAMAVFASGCVLSAMVLVGLGMALGKALEGVRERQMVRFAGVAIALAGVFVHMVPAANDVVIRLLEH